jgi:hypothetical protein
MNPFDAEGYRKAAKEAGYSDADIERDIAEEMSGHANNLATPKLENKNSSLDYLTMPLVIGGSYIGGKLGHMAYKKYKDFANQGIPLTKQEKLAERIDPLLNVNQEKPTGRIEPTFEPVAPVAPSATAPVTPVTPVTPNQTPAPFAENTPVLPSSNPNGRIGVGNMPENGYPAPFATNNSANINNPNAQVAENTLAMIPPKSPAEQVIEQKTDTAPKPAVPASAPIGETNPNPVQSGEGTSPLHEPGAEAGKTQVEATAESTGEAKKKPVVPTAEIPEGRIPNYMTGKKKASGAIEYKNKQGSDVIGKGGWNWYQGQMGPEAEENWLHQFGRTNQPYNEVVQAVKEGRLKGPEVSEGKGGKFTREPHVPNYIKGSATPEAMGSLAMGSLGALMAAHNIKNDIANAREAEAKGDIGMRNAHYRNIFSNIPILGDLLVDSPEQYAAMREEERRKKAK